MNNVSFDVESTSLKKTVLQQKEVLQIIQEVLLICINGILACQNMSWLILNVEV